MEYFGVEYDIRFLSIPIPDLDQKYFIYKRDSKLYNFLIFLKILFFNDYDHFVFAGGSTYKVRKFLSKRFLIDFFIKKNKVIFGAGIGPFKSQRDQDFFIKLFRQYSLILVRDKSSLKYSGDIRLEEGTDIAHNYIVRNFYDRDLRKDDVIGVSFATSAYKVEQDFYNHFIQNINPDKTYYLFILNVAELLRDAHWIHRLAGELSKRDVNYKIFSIDEKSSNYLLRRMNECSYMYTSRLHSAISSYSLKIPQTCQPYAPKTLAFLKDIGWKGDKYASNVHTEDFSHFADIHESCTSMFVRLEKYLNEN